MALLEEKRGEGGGRGSGEEEERGEGGEGQREIWREGEKTVDYFVSF